MRISSNSTLFYKFFLPTFWIFFGGACAITTWAFPIRIISGLPPEIFRIVFSAFYLLVALLLLVRSNRWKRVELDDQYLYVSNYFKNYRYLHKDIESISETVRPLFSTASIKLKSSGSFGDRIYYIPKKDRMNIFLQDHPHIQLPIQ